MSATDELCRLLDELRNLARDINENEINSHSVILIEHRQYNRQLRLDMNRDWLNAWHTEFERILQSIAATLGNDGVERSKNGLAERDQLKAENAKLRKLAGALFDCSRDGLYTDELPCQWCDLKSQEVCERMAKELGVIE